MRLPNTLMTARLIGAIWIVVGQAITTYSHAQGSSPPPAPTSFFDGLINDARKSAAGNYKESASQLPDYLTELSYDGYKAIEFRREQGLWHGASGRLQVRPHRMCLRLSVPSTLPKAKWNMCSLNETNFWTVGERPSI